MYLDRITRESVNRYLSTINGITLVKNSGIDNEGSKYGLEDYLNIKYSLIG